MNKMLSARSAAIRQAILRGFLGFPAVIWFLSFTKYAASEMLWGVRVLPSGDSRKAT